jgi:ribosomal protein S3
MGQLTVMLWNVLHSTEQIFTEQSDVEVKLKAAHTLTGLSGVYIKALETHVLETRLSEVEEELRELRQAHRVSRSATQKPDGKPLN